MKKKIVETEILKIEDVKKFKSDNILNFSDEWEIYWRNKIKEEYQVGSLVEKIQKREQVINCLNYELAELKAQNDMFFEENISLGERIDNLKQQNSKQHFEILNLKSLTNTESKGFFDLGKKLITKNIAVQDLRQENEKLKIENKQSKVQIQESKNNPIFAAIDKKIVDQIIELRFQGKTCTEIAKTTKIAQSTVSRYLNKDENKKRLNQMQYDLNTHASN